MGCTGSKPVDAIDPDSGEKKVDPATVTNGNGGLMGDMAPTTAPSVNGSIKVAQPSPDIPPPPPGSDDVHWNRLWDSHRTFLLDPADIHATIEDLMARSTNKLSGTEINLIQRKVRKVIRKSGSKDGKKGIPFSKSSGSDEDRLIAERQHLLTSNAIQNILPALAGPAEPTSVTPATSIFLLLLHTHESMWDKVFETAVAETKAAGLSMDVNALQPPTRCPAIPKKTSNNPTDLPAGVSLQSLTFMIGLALRGTRQQRLQLLFYLLLPSKVLSKFLSEHPAGGVPLWLFEVGNETILSVSSLSHYYHYGDAFTPGAGGDYCPSKDTSPLTVNGTDATSFLDVLLSDQEEVNGGTEPKPADPKAALPSKSSFGIRRRSSHNSIETSGEYFLDSTQTEVMDKLHDDKYTFSVEEIVPDVEATLAKMSGEKLPAGAVPMSQFKAWSESALDNSALDAIMHRLFGHGMLPSPALEADLVMNRWIEWQESDCIEWLKLQQNDSLTSSVRKALSLDPAENAETAPTPKRSHRRVFGGLDGFDGRGGLGNGVMYCVEKKWWDSWEAYTGWSWGGESAVRNPDAPKPETLSTEALIDRDQDEIVGGTFGSYELMKSNLVLGQDYVLVPPGVWDVLYEIYGGGPPLPRMVGSGKKDFGSDLASYVTSLAATKDTSEMDLDAVSSGPVNRALKVPKAMQVETHPWILHFHLCDPQQPYRRGDAGPMTVRVMATPDQPLWRLYAEIVGRLPFSAFKVYGNDGRGRARLWKRVEQSGPKDAMSRFGPWTILCKNRFAILPSTSRKEEAGDQYDELKKSWEEFGSGETVQSIGLANGDQVMVECASLNRSGQFMWPREAAAKAGQVRRLADKDTQFRRMLRGLDENGKPLEKPPALVGMVLDAMDSAGRWYQVEVIQVQDVDDTDDDDSMRSDYSGDGPRDSKELLLDFSEHGGHSEWIEIASDRLAAAGRFTVGEDDGSDDGKKGPNGANNNAKGPAQVKKTNQDTDSHGKLCTIPGYGACGLANLGNTCYANSAIQCISYMPLLRAYLLNSQYKSTGELNKDNPLGTGGKLLEEFAELLRVMWSAKLGEKSPNKFKSQLGRCNMQFAGADQQDAQEFLNFMLDALHEDSNRVIKKPYVEGLEDDWVKQTGLSRVGDEAWRRFLRRNRSVMADIAMGQVLNSVTCSSCGFTSRNFDPFNLLSVPFPEVADVIFRVHVVRRANVFNTPWVLNKPKKTAQGGGAARFPFRGDAVHKPPSDHLVVEEYVVAMSRLADSNDLRDEIQERCGIPASHLRLCKAEDVAIKGDDRSVVRQHTQVTPLTDKEGPCSQFARRRGPNGEETNEPPLIVAFESTLRSRPKDKSKEDFSDSEDDYSGASGVEMTDREVSRMEEEVVLYGNSDECRLFDTEPTTVAKAVSRSLWPRTEEDFKLGLRVDAIDHKQHWFPGSIVEILENSGDKDESKDQDGAKTKVRIHFDNFSSKWDEMYTIDHFNEGRVKPLYSHAVPRSRPTEFVCHHRYMDRTKRLSSLFGQTFFVQCQNEWSTARAGAQILAQASRFLKLPQAIKGPVDVDDNGEREAKIQRLYDRTQTVLSDLIDLLIDCDREYIQSSLALGADGKVNPSHQGEKYRNPSFDATGLSASLVKRVNTLLHRLPFEVRVCTAESPLGGTNDEVAFPFSLMRTIGNYMNSRHAVVLQWREPPSDKKATGKNVSYLGAPVMYVPPAVNIDGESAEILEELKAKGATGSSGHNSAGLRLGVCLSEYCKVQDLEDDWACPQCRERRGKQSLDLWRLPDILTIHIKRFNCSARWREKITTKVNFPLSGLDMNTWCHADSPSIQGAGDEANTYDLIGVMNHYGGMTGGHYVATCKATACSREGREEVAHGFNGAGSGKATIVDEDTDGQSGWRIGRQKSEVNFNKLAAVQTGKTTEESAEPLWLQFDDEMVEPIAPRNVVSEMAYVLFYRRRQLTPSNVARYSVLE
ncbi:unnamed protein product [Cylindrotheca closterium]|uniref:Ubiquitinyl hydrolase 1 n=1 Tax=Cylindrotheca closterium TaxID=2856 RepID=A0AAD2CWX3_9STRA|nr:unnamed protein product [Cylindrotheca closterium]